MLPRIDDYRPSIERLASRALGETVTIRAIDASWRGLRPMLALSDVRVVDREGRAVLALPALRATLSWESLAAFDLRLASLAIDRPMVEVSRDASGQLYVAGFAIHRRETPDNKALEWLMAQDAIHVRGATVTWTDALADRAHAADGSTRGVAVEAIDATLRRDGWRHRFAMRASPPPDLGAPLDVRGRIDHPFFSTRLADPATWSGEVYANVASGDLAGWRRVLDVPSTIESGRGRLRAWMRFVDAASAVPLRMLDAAKSVDPRLAPLGRIAELTADVALDDMAAHWGATGRVALRAADGRIEATQDATRGKGLAQSVRTHALTLKPVDGRALAPTELSLKRSWSSFDAPETEAGEASLNAIDVTTAIGLVPADVLPAATAEKLASYRPRGALDTLTMRWQGPVIAPLAFEFGARFAGLAIAPQPPSAEAVAAAGKAIVAPNGLVRKPRAAFWQPGFENLAGTFSATRTRRPDAAPETTATVALASSDAVLVAPGLFDDPRLKLARVAASVRVRQQDQDSEVRIEDATFENADLAGTAKVVFKRGPHSGSERRGWIDVDAHVVRADVARVPRYLPNIIGERARLYLSRALVSGRVVDATFRMLGTLEKLDVRAQADSLARDNPVTLVAALDALGAAKAPASNPASNPSTPPADEAVLHAVVKVKDATYLYGPARSVEEILAAAAANGVTLPQPVLPTVAWPAFEDVDADVIFDHATMTIVARNARVGAFRLDDVKVELPALADPAHVLRAVGKGAGPLQDLVRFVNASPIARWTRNAFATSEASGNATLALALDLPLTHARDTAVAGRLGLENDDLAVNATTPPLRKLNGRVDFTDRGLATDGLTAQVLGGPLRVDAQTKSNGFVEIAAHGTLDAQALRAASADDSTYAPPRIVERLAHRLSGSTPYAASVRVRSKRYVDLQPQAAALAPKADATPDVVIESTLAGLAIDLPAPLGKAAADAMPLRVEITRNTATTADGLRDFNVIDGENVRVALGDLAHADVARRRDTQGRLAVTRAAYAVGPVTPFTDGPPSARISVPALDLDAWRDVAKDLAGPQKPAAAVNQAATRNPLFDALVPDRIDLTAGSLRAASRTFDHVHLQAGHVASGWEGDIAADQVAGHIAYRDVSGTAAPRSGIAPAASARLVARLTHLSIPQAEASGAHVDEALDATRQRDFPAVDLVADRFELRGRSLGRLEVQAENVGDDMRREWKLEKLGLTMPEARFDASGAWGRAIAGDGASGAAPDDTRLSFSIDASDVGALLDRFGVSKTIKDGTAKLSGDASWQGSPTRIDYATMNGHVALDAGKGQFLKADPGVAKLLNVLSLQSIPRRLMLDFSDVFEAGFAFDSIKADAVIERGVASTDDFTMHGVQATVVMQGKADFANETTDLHVLVLPQLDAGAAALGVAVVNPVLGLATFVAQYLFKDPIARALSFEYNVAGPWAKPVVTRIDRDGHATPVAPRGATASREGAKPVSNGTAATE